MTDWMTIRVVLHGQPDDALRQPPGRIMLVHTDHAFADLAEAVDTAFARWDLSPPHQFDVEGRVLVPIDDSADLAPTVEDSDQVTVGQVGLRVGAPFRYTFDLGEQWLHECVVEEIGVDPFEVAGEEPEFPVPVFGWGTIPDQYGRVTESDEETVADGSAANLPADPFETSEVVDLEDDVDEDALTGWNEAESDSWSVVEQALASSVRPPDPDALATAMTQLRSLRTSETFPHSVLWSAVGGADTELPDDEADAWLALAAATVAPADVTPLDIDAQAAWAALELADWAGAVIELVRGGPGTSATPEDLVELVKGCPEIEGEDLSSDDEDVLVEGFSVVVPLWGALGILDAQHLLTPLGAWGLPQALRTAWAT